MEESSQPTKPPRHAPIGLLGCIESGKDTVAQMLVDEYSYTSVAFATKVKDLLYHLNPYIPEASMSYQELINTVGYDIAKRTYPTVRQMLVKLGEGARAILYDDIWIDCLRDMSHMSSMQPPLLVFSDVRHENEAAYIRSLGGSIWHIRRSSPPKNSAVPIEEILSIAEVQADFVIHNDGTLEDLHQCIKTQMQGRGSPYGGFIQRNG
jgi:hypothetical protein